MRGRLGRWWALGLGLALWGLAWADAPARVGLPPLTTLRHRDAAPATGQPPPPPPPQIALAPIVPPAQALDYVTDVVPVLGRLGCNSASCHGSMGGKGGLKLSLFGSETTADYDALVHAGGGRLINRVEPGHSLLLAKIESAENHGGGQRVRPGTADEQLLLAWIAQGALLANPTKPTLEGISLAPAEATLTMGQSQAFKVVANFSDGSTKDITVNAELSSLAPTVGRLAGTNLTAVGFGQCDVVASWLRQSAVARVLVPQVLTSAFPTVPTAGRIDEICLDKLKQLGMPPSEVCDDPTYLRRVYTDLIGVLPTPEEATAFLTDTAADKRTKLVDQLMARTEFVDFWALKWSDLLRIKSEYPVRVWPKAVQIYYRWVWDAVAANLPYDQFVKTLLLSSGSDFRDGPCNFYRAMTTRDAQNYGESVALLFMGARVGCAHCHAHPYEPWTLDDNLALGAFFAKIRIKNTGDLKNSGEWKEEVVCLDPDATVRDPKTHQAIAPRFLDGHAPVISPGDDPRAVFVHWLTAPDNPWFGRNIANRVWFWLMGRGLVNEPDDLRPSNPPSCPELLDYLATDLMAHKWDLRSLMRAIVTSRTYQLASDATPLNKDDPTGFSHHLLRRLPAEVLDDAICRVTLANESFWTDVSGINARLPKETRAVQLVDGSISSAFLELLGRPSRDTPYESERCLRTSMRQAMHLMNSSDIENKVNGGERLKKLLAAGRTDADVVDEIYLAAFARHPSEAERQNAVAYLGRDPKNRPAAVADLLWAVLNTKEFLFNR
jgi:hypothetical protein